MKTVLSRSGDSPQVANKNQEDRGSSCGITQKKDACPAKQKKCRKYGKLSHFARVCRSKAQKVPEINADTTQNNAQSFFVGSGHAHDELLWRLDLDVCSRKINFKIDTRADIDVIS